MSRGKSLFCAASFGLFFYTLGSVHRELNAHECNILKWNSYYFEFKFKFKFYYCVHTETRKGFGKFSPALSATELWRNFFTQRINGEKDTWYDIILPVFTAGAMLIGCVAIFCTVTPDCDGTIPNCASCACWVCAASACANNWLTYTK